MAPSFHFHSDPIAIASAQLSFGSWVYTETFWTSPSSVEIYSFNPCSILQQSDICKTQSWPYFYPV